ncbi:hypothetical protein HJI43_15950 [Enterobacter cloacae]|uniref:tail fiber/spike domain-containing protein n=1 Tax=Enterobacter TaxID=547 RepID=UPI001463D2EC|nr:MULTISPECIES: hypothetical protein [Enterobacter]EEW7582250.1 hypothetical protein [Escherichia coli]QJP77227.1 hypothetical protein HJI43_15950 [Enterobacter cloacae]ELX1420880.1 hypothetical protein [Escherichia coli]MCE1500378.1 hypothetical protein [Enterobacter hormaechei]NPO08430.1 hypothetical protein [Escherichia coli]
MATQPTNLSVPSESPRDLKFNAGKIDEFVTSFSQWYVDRFGVQHYTIEGLKQLVLQQIYNLGWNLKGTFQGGGTVTAAGDLLQDTTTLIWYRWDDLSTLPKDVPSGSTPASAGGTGPGKWQPVEVSDVLRKDLSAADGFKLIGRCATVTALRLVEPTINKQMISLVEYASGTGYGGGILWYDNTDTTSADNGVDVFVTAGGKRWKRLTSRITLLDAGGVPGTDSSVALQRLVDAKKGKLVVIPEGEFIVAGITLNNSSYNNTRFQCEGMLKLKQRTSTSENNAGMPAYMGILLKDVFDVTGHLRFDGQRTLQPDEEHIYCVGIAGGGRFDFTHEIKDIKGDGFYVSQSDWLSNSAITNGLRLRGTISNGVIDGRNAISVISCKNFNIDVSINNVGGIVGGVQQPGGVDLEPNFDYQIIDSGFINIVADNSAFGVCILGKSYNVNNLKIKAILSNNCKPYLTRFKNCDIDIQNKDGGVAAEVDTCVDSKIKIRHHNCNSGAIYGFNGQVLGCEIETIGTQWKDSVAGHYDIQSCIFKVSAYDCLGTGTGFAWIIGIPNGKTSAYIPAYNRYSIDCPRQTNAVYAIRNASNLVLTRCILCNSNLGGWNNWGEAVLGQVANVIESTICNTLSSSNAMPGSGYYPQGVIVKANSNTVTSGQVLYGWLRLTTSNSHILDTDWKAVKFLW